MIQIENLHKRLGGQEILRGVAFEVLPREITVIIGRSGEGKSVLLRHVLGLFSPDQGEIVIDGERSSTFDDVKWNQVRRRFGMLFQNAALFDSMSVFDNIAFPLREHLKLSREACGARVDELLALVGLEGASSKFPAELSGGMRKRVGLARAIALSPEFILYDEPTTGLDPIVSASIYDLMLDMQRKFKVTSLVISHDMEGAMRIADKIVVLDQGRIEASGTPAEIVKSDHRIVKAFFHKVKMGA